MQLCAMPMPEPNVAELLRELTWLRGLARTLVADPSLAEDLAQDACLAALQHPPKTDRPLRAWLAKVARNARGRGLRHEGAREAVERNADERGPTPAPEELVERLATQRALVEAVASLKEPYRETVVLRYFEERSPTDIARNLGVPVSTIKTRLARGLDRLRTRLEDRYGGEEGLLGALLPIAELAGGASLAAPTASGTTASEALGRARLLPKSPSLLTGTLVVNIKLLSLLGAAAIAIALIVSRRDGASAAPETPNTAAVDGTLVVLENEPELVHGSPAETSRIEVAATPSEPPATGTPSAPPIEQAPVGTLDGRVLDARGAPVAGVDIVNLARPEAVRGKSDARGAFQVEAPGARARYGINSPAWITVLAATTGTSTPEREAVVVAAPRIALSGWVVDQLGAPVADARLNLGLPDGFRAGLGAVLDDSETQTWRGSTDASGRFELADAPGIPGLALIAAHRDHAPKTRALNGADQHGITIVLGEFEPSPTAVRGRVIDAQGTPVAGAVVSLALDVTRADDAGEFALDVGVDTSTSRELERISEGLFPVAANVLRAVAPGHRPARAMPSAYDAEGHPAWDPYVVLTLAGPPLTIDGRVVDVDGNGLDGLHVWIDDPSLMGVERDPTSGRRANVHLESALAGDPFESWRTTRTAGRGRFELEGLADREYRVAVMDPATLELVEARDVRAGTRGLEIVFGEAPLFERVAGVVRDRRGRPLAGIRVAAQADPFQTMYQERPIGTHHASGAVTETDSEGRFLIEGMPTTDVYLRFDGENTIPRELGRGVEGGLAEMFDDVEDLEVELGLRCHFQIEAVDPGAFDAFEVRDADDTPLQMRIFRGTSSRDGPRLPLPESGLTEVTAVSDAGEILVLFLGGVEVDRRPIELAYGEVQKIRL